MYVVFTILKKLERKKNMKLVLASTKISCNSLLPVVSTSSEVPGLRTPPFEGLLWLEWFCKTKTIFNDAPPVNAVLKLI